MIKTYGETVEEIINYEIELEIKTVAILGAQGLTAEFIDDVLHITGRTLMPSQLVLLQERWEVSLNNKFYFRKLRPQK